MQSNVQQPLSQNSVDWIFVPLRLPQKLHQDLLRIAAEEERDIYRQIRYFLASSVEQNKKPRSSSKTGRRVQGLHGHNNKQILASGHVLDLQSK